MPEIKCNVELVNTTHQAPRPSCPRLAAAALCRGATVVFLLDGIYAAVLSGIKRYVHVASGRFRCFSSAPAMAEAMPAFPLDVRAEMQAREEKLKKENANYLEGHPDV